MRALLPILFALTACGMASPIEQKPVPDGGYAAFPHYGTNPVIDSADEALVRIGLSADHASWTLVRHYLDRGVLPPPEAVRVEDCIAALAPGITTKTTRIQTSLAPSPFRPGWHVLVVTVAAPTINEIERPLVVTQDPDGPLEQALVARGARIYGGDAAALPAALRSGERVVLVSDGAGLGGPQAQSSLLLAIAEDHEAGAIVSVAGHVRPGLDDALLDRIAEAGGGIYDLIVPGEERQLAERLMRRPGLDDALLEARFDAKRVERWRLVGHENRTVRAGRGLGPTGGLIPSGDVVDVIFELKLAPGNGDLGRIRLGARDELRDIAIRWDPKQIDPRHRAVVAIAAVAEKLRGSFWGLDYQWDAIAAEVAQLPSPALRDELGGAITKARALWTAQLGIERPSVVVRAIP